MNFVIAILTCLGILLIYIIIAPLVLLVGYYIRNIITNMFRNNKIKEKFKNIVFWILDNTFGRYILWIDKKITELKNDYNRNN